MLFSGIQLRHKLKWEQNVGTHHTEEQCTEPPNSSPSFSRVLLKDQGIEPLQNKQALQILC